MSASAVRPAVPAPVRTWRSMSVRPRRSSGPRRTAAPHARRRSCDQDRHDQPGPGPPRAPGRTAERTTTARSPRGRGAAPRMTAVSPWRPHSGTHAVRVRPRHARGGDTRRQHVSASVGLAACERRSRTGTEYEECGHGRRIARPHMPGCGHDGQQVSALGGRAPRQRAGAVGRAGRGAVRAGSSTRRLARRPDAVGRWRLRRRGRRLTEPRASRGASTVRAIVPDLDGVDGRRSLHRAENHRFPSR